MMALAAVALIFSCTPPSADEHPNHKPDSVEEEEDPSLVVDELGTLSIQLADYQQQGIKVKSIEIIGNNGEQINGTYVLGSSGVQVSSGASGTLTVTYSTPQDISWKAEKTPWTGAVEAAAEFSVMMTAAEYEKGLTLKITDDKDRCFKYVCDRMVIVESEETVSLGALPVTLYYGSANSVLTPASAGTVEIDVTPHVSFSTAFIPEGGEVLGADGKALVEARSADIVWQLGQSGVEGDVIGTPTLSGNTLKVPKTGKKGNAVVAVKDASGTVIWSFHIWVGDAKDVPCNFPGKYENFTLMDRNLGATTTEAANPDSYGNLYQWGRKDAFCRPHGLARQGARTEVFPFEGCSHELTGEAVGTIAYSIRHPEVRIKSTSSLKDWHFFPRVQGLWGNTKAASDPLKSAVKTVYDPCPAGYQIPEKEAFSGFTLNDADMYNSKRGFLYPTGIDDGSTIYFPVAGTVQHTSDNMMYYEYEGFVWSCNPGSGGVYVFRFGDYGSTVKSAVSPLDRAYASSVRCIKTSI